MLKRLIYGMLAMACGLSVCLPSRAGEDGAVPFTSIAVKRLPDMNVPRSGFVLARVDGDFVVIGGRTTGFKLAPGGEYFHNGRWRLIKSYYSHDDSFSAVFPSGEILVGGGHAQEFGIGQCFSVETYNHKTGEFTPFPILDNKRALAHATLISGDRIVVSGNWYAPDSIEIGEPGKGFITVKAASQNRSAPVMLRISDDDVLLFGSIDSRGNELDSVVVDRLVGDPLDVPLLKTWKPSSNMMGDFRFEDSAIRTPPEGDYTYLLTARDTSGAWGIIKVEGEKFSLLETDMPVPSSSKWGPVTWRQGIIADRDARRAWMVGFDKGQHIFLLGIDWSQVFHGGKASLRFYATDEPMTNVGLDSFVLTGDGGLFGCGGIKDSNYTPFSGACILYPDGLPRRPLPWLPCLAVLLALAAAVFFHARKRRPAVEEPEQTVDEESRALMEKIDALMEEGLFRTQSLKLSDIAIRLGTNVRYVSECINRNTGVAFPIYVNGKRIRYAVDIMKANPQKKFSEVAEQCGFRNEGTFFRNFKLIMGVTPSQWISDNTSN